MNVFKTGSALGVAALVATLAASMPTGASAETATDLKCKGCVGKKDIGKKAIRTRNLKKNAVKSKVIKDGSIEPEDLALTAKPTGAADNEPAAFGFMQPLSPTYEDIISTTLTAPTEGYVIAIANWYFYITAAAAFPACVVTTESGSSIGPAAIAGSSAATTVATGSQTRMFEVPAGATTFYLNCSGPASTGIVDPHITAMFVPNRY
jgi:hypothetical protein